MADHHDLDPSKFEPEAIRLNLMVASLYIFVFELLRLTIVEGVKAYFLFQGTYSDEQIDEIRALASQYRDLGFDADADRTESGLHDYHQQLERFKEAVGTRYESAPNHLLVPCAKWLASNGVLSNDDVGWVSSIRDHRNAIAHEIHNFLFGMNIDVDFDLLAKAREVLRNVGLFWFRNDLHFDASTGGETDIEAIPDEDVFSGKEAFLQMAIDAVRSYADQLAD